MHVHPGRACLSIRIEDLDSAVWNVGDVNMSSAAVVCYKLAGSLGKCVVWSGSNGIVSLSVHDLQSITTFTLAGARVCRFLPVISTLLSWFSEVYQISFKIMSKKAIKEILFNLNQVEFVDFIAQLFAEFMQKW